MTEIPSRFRAFVVDQEGERVERGVREIGIGDLPEGSVTIRVEWSGVNYKDGLASTANGKVARISPLIPGVDLAGTVLASDDPEIAPGTAVLAHGYDLGVARCGGWTEIERVPAEWGVPLPPGLTARDAMAIGTAGFTAALSVARLEARGLEPSSGPVLVTGATGGVGRTALGILADRGYEVWAATGKASERDRLLALGATGVLDRSEVMAESAKPLERERWAGAVDCIGGSALPYILRTLRHGGAAARASRRRSSRSSSVTLRSSASIRSWSRCRSGASSGSGSPPISGLPR